jgi:signal-transduction protein with cAMP-binding, CBS, and nucleotidyltransferase domain
LADEVARQHGIRHLVVAQGERVVGVVCRCDLVPPVAEDEAVAARMEPLPCAVGVEATLGEAAAAMRARGIAMLVVVNGHELVGVITRGDLRRVGVPEELLGAHTCMACGSSHGVCCPPQNPGAEFCLDCIDKAGAPLDAEEPGGGD